MNSNPHFRHATSREIKSRTKIRHCYFGSCTKKRYTVSSTGADFHLTRVANKLTRALQGVFSSPGVWLTIVARTKEKRGHARRLRQERACVISPPFLYTHTRARASVFSLGESQADEWRKRDELKLNDTWSWYLASSADSLGTKYFKGHFYAEWLVNSELYGEQTRWIYTDIADVGIFQGLKFHSWQKFSRDTSLH